MYVVYLHAEKNFCRYSPRPATDTKTSKLCLFPTKTTLLLAFFVYFPLLWKIHKELPNGCCFCWKKTKFWCFCVCTATRRVPTKFFFGVKIDHIHTFTPSKKKNYRTNHFRAITIKSHPVANGGGRVVKDTTFQFQINIEEIVSRAEYSFQSNMKFLFDL